MIKNILFFQILGKSGQKLSKKKTQRIWANNIIIAVKQIVTRSLCEKLDRRLNSRKIKNKTKKSQKVPKNPKP